MKLKGFVITKEMRKNARCKVGALLAYYLRNQRVIIKLK